MEQPRGNGALERSSGLKPHWSKLLPGKTIFPPMVSCDEFAPRKVLLLPRISNHYFRLKISCLKAMVHQCKNRFTDSPDFAMTRFLIQIYPLAYLAVVAAICLLPDNMFFSRELLQVYSTLHHPCLW
jgi:hypothetical protein